MHKTSANVGFHGLTFESWDRRTPNEVRNMPCRAFEKLFLSNSLLTCWHLEKLQGVALAHHRHRELNSFAMLLNNVQYFAAMSSIFEYFCTPR